MKKLTIAGGASTVHTKYGHPHPQRNGRKKELANEFIAQFVAAGTVEVKA